MARTNNRNRSKIGHWEGPRAPREKKFSFICPPSVFIFFCSEFTEMIA